MYTLQINDSIECIIMSKLNFLWYRIENSAEFSKNSNGDCAPPPPPIDFSTWYGVPLCLTPTTSLVLIIISIIYAHKRRTYFH